MKQELIYRKLINTGLMDKEQLRFCIEQFRVNPDFRKYANLFQVIEAIGYLTKDQISSIIKDIKNEIDAIGNEPENSNESKIFNSVSKSNIEEINDTNAFKKNNNTEDIKQILIEEIYSKGKSKALPLDSILHPGYIIRGCKLIQKIGEGSMGQVWVGEHLSLKVDVALKILHQENYENKILLERFYREAHQVAKLDHQNIVRVYDVGSDNNLHLIIMQYIDGPPLSELESSKQVNFEDSLNYIMQTLSGLDYAQKKGIIHRDIKLENLMLTTDGIVKLTDFGFGRDTKGKNVQPKNRLTVEGDIFGTPFYMPPEQWDDTHSVGHQTDVYSTGVALFKLLTGRFPVEGDTAFQIISKLMSGKKAHIRDYMPEIDKDLEHIIEKSIHIDLEKRYQTPFDFGIRLSKYCLKNKLYHTIPSEFLRVTALQVTKHKKKTKQTIKTEEKVDIQSKCFDVKKVSEISNTLVLKCTIKWDLQRLIEFENMIEQIITKKKYRFLLIDMSEVNKINSTTLSSLNRMNDRFRANGGKIAIFNPTKQLQVIMQIFSIDSTLPVLKNVEEAKNYINKQF